MTCKECGHYEVCEYTSIVSKTVERDCRAFIDASKFINIPKTGIGDLSDGYHTFNELYHHRAILFSLVCNAFPFRAWKSKKHHEGDMFEGMFIVGIETPEGQATYHYNIEPYWDMFKVNEVSRAPKWDGHTPAQAIERLKSLSDLKSANWNYDGTCSHCGEHLISTHTSYCGNCGSRMKQG